MMWNKLDPRDPSSYPPVNKEVLLYIDLSQTTKKRDKMGEYQATHPRIHTGCLRRLLSYYRNKEESNYYRRYAETESDLPEGAYSVKVDPIFTSAYGSGSITHWAYITPPDEHINQTQSY